MDVCHVCMRACMYVLMYIYVHICTCIYIYKQTYVYTRVYIYIYTHIHIYIHTYIHTSTYVERTGFGDLVNFVSFVSFGIAFLGSGYWVLSKSWSFWVLGSTYVLNICHFLFFSFKKLKCLGSGFFSMHAYIHEVLWVHLIN